MKIISEEWWIFPLNEFENSENIKEDRPKFEYEGVDEISGKSEKGIEVELEEENSLDGEVGKLSEESEDEENSGELGVESDEIDDGEKDERESEAKMDETCKDELNTLTVFTVFTLLITVLLHSEKVPVSEAPPAATVVYGVEHCNTQQLFASISVFEEPPLGEAWYTTGELRLV